MEKVTISSEGHQLSGRLYPASIRAPVAVVLCHGAFEHQGNWANLAESLAKEGLTALTFDFVGHGESEGLRGWVDLRIWAYNIRDAMNYLAAKGYRRFALVGWDSGGSAAILATAHDTRVRCAVTLATPIFLMPPIGERLAFGLATVAASVKRTFWKKPLTLSRIAELEEMRIAVDDETNHKYLHDPLVRACYQAVPVPESLHSAWLDITRAARKVNKPMLIIHGTNDAVLPVDQSKKLHAALQGEKQLLFLQGVGHAIHLDHQHEQVYKTISKWIRQHLN
jgi:acylglycerol lipase